MPRSRANIPDKYKIENQAWTHIDQKPNCTQKPVPCKTCLDKYKIENYGHMDIYLDSSRKNKKEIGAIIVCKHAHFVTDVDRGRNVWCVIEKIMIPKIYLKLKYVLNDKIELPSWIVDKLNGKDL